MTKWLKALLIAGLIWFGFQFIIYRSPIALGKLWPKIISVKEMATQEEVHTHSFADINELYLETTNGNVIIIGSGDCPEIVIKVKYEARESNKENAEDILRTLSTEIKKELGGRLFVKAAYGRTKSNISIHYEVTVPHNLAVQVKTTNGRITCNELEGKLQLTSTNGNININSGIGPQEVFARTTNGGIVLKAKPMGNIYDLKTTNGNIKMYLPRELGIDITAKTSNGRIGLGNSDWLMSGNNLSNKSVEAKRGDGSLELRVVTSNGSINLYDPE